MPTPEQVRAALDLAPEDWEDERLDDPLDVHQVSPADRQLTLLHSRCDGP